MARSSQQTQIDWDAVGSEVLSHFQAILRLDTRNPPGNESKAAEYLRSVLEQEGIECQIVGPSPDRATLIARLKGDGSEQPFLLMSHTDVVAVELEKWSHDPFAADISNGFVYARGALDMKNMVTMELMVMLLLKRSGIPLKRDVIYMAAADEEVGGQQGAGWVVQHHPELIQAEYAFNEGGGNGLEMNGKLYYTVQTAEKGSARFRVSTKGKPGHGSISHGDSAILKLAHLLSKVQHNQTPVHFTASLRGYITGLASVQPPEVAQLFHTILASEEGADAAIDALPIDTALKLELHALVRNTVVPTMLHAGSQINVIPSEAVASFDARILPGSTIEEFSNELRTIFGAEAQIDFFEPSQALEADPASPLFEVIKTVMKEYEPEAPVVPTMLTGGTDAKHVAKLGTKIYGFAPELYVNGDMGWSGIHGHDERISVQSIQWGTRVLYEVVERFVSAQ